MMHRAALLLFSVVLTGCVGTDDGPDPFKLCGNMVIDRNEECDDGNESEKDDCLSTCVFNQCGDEFLDLRGPDHIEMCDGRDLNNRDCFRLGFPGGTLACAANCTFDTSGCTQPPTPTPTPEATPTATVT